MKVVIIAIAGVAAFVAAAFLVRPVGRKLKDTGVWARVLVGLLIVLVAMGIAAYGLVAGNDVLWGVGLGLGFGGLSGLRYGNGTLLDLIGRREPSVRSGARR